MTKAVVDAVVKLGEIYRPAYIGEVTARLRLATTTDRLSWNASRSSGAITLPSPWDKAIVMGVAGSYEREAIRPHVLGSFSNLLLSVESHPAMLLYLDNYRSGRPGFAAG